MKKKIIPVLIAIVLIIVIGGIGLLSAFWKKYSYSDVQMDLQGYFELEEADEVAIVLQNERLETKAKLSEGVYYLDFPSVQKLLNDRFYEDSSEMLLLYTTPSEIIRTTIGSDTYVQGQEETQQEYLLSYYEEDVLYVALDFVQQFTNFSYEAFTQPNRIQLSTEWGEATTAQVKKATAVRYQGGVKSDILRKVEAGERVTILEKMENWSKVRTDDALIGYMENKRLTDEVTAQETPASHYQEPEYTSLVREEKICLGWHDTSGSLEDIVARSPGMNVISPTWFALMDNEGGIRSLASESYVSRAHNLGLEVWALVDDLNNYGQNVDTHEVLGRTSTRTRLIENLMAEVLGYGLDGINVDFENIREETGESFVQFLRELSIQCRANGIVLSVDNYVPREHTAHYDREEQGVVADYVIIMGYDEHWGGSQVAGSVASIGFVEDGIQQTLEVVPAEKVINGIPFYTRVWKTKAGEVTSEAIDMETAQNFLIKNQIQTSWDEAACQNYGELQKGDTLYQVWMEDAKSIETKLTIMKKYQLGGVAAWKLGYETADIWGVISAYMNS